MSVRRISPREARALQVSGALLVDVRAAHERALGMADGALGIEREALERDPALHLPDPAREVVLLCQKGQRSLLSAPHLCNLSVNCWLC